MSRDLLFNEDTELERLRTRIRAHGRISLGRARAARYLWLLRRVVT